MRKLPLHFDSTLPFVAAIQRSLHQGTPLRDAIAPLEAAEQEQDLCILYSPDNFLPMGGYLARNNEPLDFRQLYRQISDDEVDAEKYQRFLTQFEYLEITDARLDHAL